MPQIHSIKILHDIIGMALTPDVSKSSTPADVSSVPPRDYNDRQERRRQADAIRKDMSPQEREELKEHAEARMPEATRNVVKPDSKPYAMMIDSLELDILADEQEPN